MTRGGRLELKAPKFGSICWPAGLNCAPVNRPANCVWFQALKNSARNWIQRDSEKSEKRLEADISQLLMPGPRRIPMPAVPNVPTAGRAKAAVLKL